MNTKVLLMGDPRLRRISEEVEFPLTQEFRDESNTLHKTLSEFRKEKGFGRAIAAPQIGVNKRCIALNLEGDVFTVINPVISWTSEETFSLWDDCMSFPDLLVKVKRFVSVTLNFQDEEGQEHIWEHLDRSVSELMQHEIDHLDGVLAVDRALDRESLVYRSVFEYNRAHFEKQVD